MAINMPWRTGSNGDLRGQDGKETAKLFARMLSALCQEDVEVRQEIDMMGGNDLYTVSFRRTGFRMMLTDLKEMRSMGHLEAIAEDTAKRYRSEYNGKVNNDMRGIREDVRRATMPDDHRTDAMRYEAPVNPNPKDRAKINRHNWPIDSDESKLEVKSVAPGQDLESELQAKIDKWLNK